MLILSTYRVQNWETVIHYNTALISYSHCVIKRIRMIIIRFIIEHLRLAMLDYGLCCVGSSPLFTHKLHNMNKVVNSFFLKNSVFFFFSRTLVSTKICKSWIYFLTQHPTVTPLFWIISFLFHCTYIEVSEALGIFCHLIHTVKLKCKL